MLKRAATDFDNSHTFMSNIEDGDKGSGPIFLPVLSDSTNDAPSAISSITGATLKAWLDANFIKYKSKTKKSALATLLLETLEQRSKIPRLNEDVQGYIVSFLFGFDSLNIATQLAKGFRLRAKPRLDTMLKRSDDDIYDAAMAWCEDAKAAREIYGPISILNTSEVTRMLGLFAAGEAAELFNEDISRWDVSNVTTMEGMFFKASAFNGDLSSWDVSNVTTMQAMFLEALAFNGDLSSWNVSNVTTMRVMFFDASAFNGDLSSWDVSNVTIMRAMFEYASAFNSDLSSWNVSNVTTMEKMFSGALSFDQKNIETWDLSEEDIDGMFLEVESGEEESEEEESEEEE
ncbi:hypothetical protein TrST_g12758 [Triparma strigata]|uniref:BspA family leucine-rich repeat surface protein n=1 Tax=Triparma strigata TaxID=1606541 RepID=A0A9W6ZVH6_9STRA|nr:hypothetical protein TrST_g12758 [Triparma strigata]